MNAEHASKRVMHGLTRQLMRGKLELLRKRARNALGSRAGVLAAACMKEGSVTQHGKSFGVPYVGVRQQEIGDGMAWLQRMAEGLVVLVKSGNADGGKEPWFRTNA